MIIVDIFVPSVDKSYDFQLSDTTPISIVVDEISEMVGQKERSVIMGDLQKMQLCDCCTQRILPKNQTLAECGIATGNSLILV